MPIFYTYIDEMDCLRGPFVDVQMHYWYLKGYLKPSLTIFVHKRFFGRRTTLGQLIERNGEVNPFDERGVQEANLHATAALPNDKLHGQLITQNGESNLNDDHENQEANVHVTAAMPKCPFLEAFPVEHSDSLNRLKENDVDKCSERFHKVMCKFGGKLVIVDFKKFVALEPTTCIHCDEKLHGIAVIEHPLSKRHICNVHKQGKTFSKKDRDLLFKILDHIEGAAKGQQKTQNGGTNPEHGNQKVNGDATAAMLKCPFLEAFPVEHLDILDRLDESEAGKCLRRFFVAVRNFGSKMVNVAFKKFVTLEGE
ncbi:hypothetical protein KIN20_033977 [Parelaphostrongylus tenuis]|uniref:GYF domain-containing protein n=1 Tax=Parelaphostrongylus tenuis TaxID=148309 RepID=A0AAD5WIP3_PARTN|nr:hypothetical protein KIN20_033977 [Parelaphostrongylus tenuis]